MTSRPAQTSFSDRSHSGCQFIQKTHRATATSSTAAARNTTASGRLARPACSAAGHCVCVHQLNAPTTTTEATQACQSHRRRWERLMARRGAGPV
ncbi:MAG: hypothetical protein A3C53_00395 [Omnitrophica WOR_2 bacterium RIFCSPHIGHO2_02_FULL_68_15]|nr:MAG: hypothetical protein A3C53_00395 [Omnitrophica WOR_2 bacterium RIFCSPHIGHO2_02_FULL_68_15]